MQPVSTRNYRKVVIIGAGGASFTQGFIADFIQSQTPWSWQLTFVDISEKGLSLVCRLAQRMMEAKGSTISITASTNRQDALLGADAVVVMIAVGGRDAWRNDIEIPRKYGSYMTGGETCGPSGISRALRMIPPIVEIARDVKRLCPDAVFINYSNPVPPLCLAVSQQVGIEMIGVCAGVPLTKGLLARIAGVAPERTSGIAVGLNHLSWVYSFLVDGTDGWPRIDAGFAAGTAAEYPFCRSLYERYRAFPSVNDHHAVEFYPERFADGRYQGSLLGQEILSFDWLVNHIEAYATWVRQEAEADKPIDPEIFTRRMWCQEDLIPMLSDLFAGKNTTYSVNMINQGQISNLPTGFVFEQPACTMPTGFSPLSITDFPEQLAAQVRRRLPSIQMTVEAAISGSVRLFAEAMLLDGAVTQPSVADALAWELVLTHQAYLPQFPESPKR